MIIAFVVYIAIFGIYTNLPYKDNQWGIFIKETNNKAFAFLIGTLTLQFLSSLFSHQNFDYQNQLALNKARADKIENIIKNLMNRSVSYWMAFHNYHGLCGLEFDKSVQNSPTETIDTQAPEFKLRGKEINKQKDLWFITTQNTNAEFNLLNLQPLYYLIEGSTIQYNNLYAAITGYSYGLQKLLDIIFNNTGIYQNILSNILEAQAYTARNGVDLPCPSEEDLQSFLKYTTQLEIVRIENSENDDIDGKQKEKYEFVRIIEDKMIDLISPQKWKQSKPFDQGDLLINQIEYQGKTLSEIDTDDQLKDPLDVYNGKHKVEFVSSNEPEWKEIEINNKIVKRLVINKLEINQKKIDEWYKNAYSKISST